MSKTYDVIVIGLGAMGLASAYELARRGQRVLGLEQFAPFHDNGSSHGESRVIRRAYFEHSDYVPLLNRSYEGWAQLEKISGKKIFEQVGLAIFADPQNSVVYRESLKSAKLHGIPIEELSGPTIQKKFPYLMAKTNHQCLFEPGGGFLRVDAALGAYYEMAKKLGGNLLFEQKIQSIHPHSAGWEVRVDTTTYYASHLVLTAGAWSRAWPHLLDLPLKLYRVFLYWFGSEKEMYFQKGVPCFAFHLQDDFYYGFPSLDGTTVKLAAHFAKDLIKTPEQKAVPGPDRHKLESIQRMIGRHLPFVDQKCRRFSTCLYTMTADENFIIDTHPQYSNLAFACGFSGHGFKFAPVVGELISDLLLKGARTPDFLRLARQSLGGNE